MENQQEAPKKQTIMATHTHTVVGSACATTPPDWREDAAAVAAVDLCVCVCACACEFIGVVCQIVVLWDPAAAIKHSRFGIHP